MRYMLTHIGTILTLLLIATPAIFSANSSLQPEFSIQNMGNILIQDNFAETIFFEYGAESGVVGTQQGLQPPWDNLRGSGTGGYGGTLEIDDTHARTGSKSIYLYQEPPPKVDADRRVTLQLYGSTTQQHEGYWSFWMYVDNNFVTENPEWGPNLGGFGIRFGPSGGKLYRWGLGASFHVSSGATKRIWASLGINELTDGIHFSTEADNELDGQWYLDDVIPYYMNDFVGEWVHWQMYFKIDTTLSGNGIHRMWFSAPEHTPVIEPTLFQNVTGVNNDPRAYSAWNNPPVGSGPCEFYFKNPDAKPKMSVMLYQGLESFENWMWVDDVVAATEKVPETYGVYS